MASCVDEWLTQWPCSFCVFYSTAEFYSWVTTLAKTFLRETGTKQSQGRLRSNWTQRHFDTIGLQPADWAAPSSSLSHLKVEVWSLGAELCHVTSRDASFVCALTVHLQIKRPSGCKHSLNSLNWTGGSVCLVLFSSLPWFSWLESIFFFFILGTLNSGSSKSVIKVLTLCIEKFKSYIEPDTLQKHLVSVYYSGP